MTPFERPVSFWLRAHRVAPRPQVLAMRPDDETPRATR
jgi:hypothetical protein